jgi:hypothetical protein
MGKGIRPISICEHAMLTQKAKGEGIEQKKEHCHKSAGRPSERT